MTSITVTEGQYWERTASEVVYRVVAVYAHKGEVRLYNAPLKLTKQVPLFELSNPDLWRQWQGRC